MRSTVKQCAIGLVALASILIGCTEPVADTATTSSTITGIHDTRTNADTLKWHEAEAFELVNFPIIEDNLKHDTLLVQVTFDLGDGTFVMVASHQEGSFEGLRLYRYRVDPQGAVNMLAVSSPAYDSWTLLPTFFRKAVDPSTLIVLANFGEKQSWGQKAMILDEQGFKDLRFLDVALPRVVQEVDSTYIKLVGAGPRARIIETDQGLTFEFAGDSLFLFDDLRGHQDTIVAAKDVRYELAGGELRFVLNGKPIVVPQPS